VTQWYQVSHHTGSEIESSPRHKQA